MYGYKIVRTRDAGVFAGELEILGDTRLGGDYCLMRNARRLWYWKGAASLSELAMRGVAHPEACKFPMPVDKVRVFGVIEVLDATEAAKASIEGVPEWSAHAEND